MYNGVYIIRYIILYQNRRRMTEMDSASRNLRSGQNSLEKWHALGQGHHAPYCCRADIQVTDCVCTEVSWVNRSGFVCCFWGT